MKYWLLLPLFVPDTYMQYSFSVFAGSQVVPTLLSYIPRTFLKKIRGSLTGLHLAPSLKWLGLQVCSTEPAPVYLPPCLLLTLTDSVVLVVSLFA